MENRQPLNFERLPADEMQERARSFFELMKQRRSVRDFSEDPIPDGVLEHCIEVAGRAPNGANQQAWHFAVVKSAEVKRKIREAAEAEEREFYQSRAPQEWLDALDHLGTDANKPFLERAPALIAVFQKSRVVDEDGKEGKTYYPKESVGLACGFLITALHHAGLASLTHTPSPMHFLNHVLQRPASEKPFLLLVVGYPAEGCTVPEITKKSLDEIVSVH
ncbi:nitroreductase family protein [Verrucomicrobiaceae bacterium R5-34]|nr:nitroreductase family protein [Verrucomicrobiaceae bacterium R5-34]